MPGKLHWKDLMLLDFGRATGLRRAREARTATRIQSPERTKAPAHSGKRGVGYMWERYAAENAGGAAGDEGELNPRARLPRHVRARET